MGEKVVRTGSDVVLDDVEELLALTLFILKVKEFKQG